MMAFVLTILLSATLLAFSLLQLPGGVRRLTLRYEQSIASVYLGESAIVAWLEQFPAEYFAQAPWRLQLPQVETDDGFPWMKVSAAACSTNPTERDANCSRVVARVGSTFRPLSRDELREAAGLLEANLKREILGRSNLKVKSGSRRLSGRGPDHGENVSMSVYAGDLTLEFNGNVGTVNLQCDGGINVRGSARYDTLRLYSAGSIRLMGEVDVQHLEVFSRSDVELSRAVAFSGIIYSSGGISLPVKSRGDFARCADSTGGSIHLMSVAPAGSPNPATKPATNPATKPAIKPATTPAVNLANKSAPAGSRCLLPASLGGKLQAFSWSLE